MDKGEVPGGLKITTHASASRDGSLVGLRVDVNFSGEVDEPTTIDQESALRATLEVMEGHERDAKTWTLGDVRRHQSLRSGIACPFVGLPGHTIPPSSPV